MPELPDITVYVEALERHVLGHTLEHVRLASPFLLRSVDPPLREVEGREVVAVRRLGKRIAIGVAGDLWLVLHLMIAGRLRWKGLRESKPGAARPKPPGKVGLATFEFDVGTLVLTEAGSKKRASLHVAAGAAGLAAHDRGGLEVLDATLDAFRAALVARNHTLKRALTDPRIFSGIGNAYSDEILHRAKLSPFKQTGKLDDGEVAALWRAARETLTEWVERLRAEIGDGFPDKVTAFHGEMAVHGRYKEPCPVCGAPVQRIVYTANEANYCARCQTGGKLLADRALSRLLKSDWPKTLEELER